MGRGASADAPPTNVACTKGIKRNLPEYLLSPAWLAGLVKWNKNWYRRREGGRGWKGVCVCVYWRSEKEEEKTKSRQEKVFIKLKINQAPTKQPSNQAKKKMKMEMKMKSKNIKIKSTHL
jgi:hypothetical protein